MEWVKIPKNTRQICKIKLEHKEIKSHLQDRKGRHPSIASNKNDIILAYWIEKGGNNTEKREQLSNKIQKNQLTSTA